MIFLNEYPVGVGISSGARFLVYLFATCITFQCRIFFGFGAGIVRDFLVLFLGRLDAFVNQLQTLLFAYFYFVLPFIDRIFLLALLSNLFLLIFQLLLIVQMDCAVSSLNTYMPLSA